MKKIIKLTESDLKKLIKEIIENYDQYFVQNEIDQFVDAGFVKRSEVEYYKDVSDKKFVVKYFDKGCGKTRGDEDFYNHGFSFYKNGKLQFQGCAGESWDWWYKNVDSFK